MQPMNFYQSLVLVLLGFKAAVLAVVLLPLLTHVGRNIRDRLSQRRSLQGLMTPRTRAKLDSVAIFRTSFMLLFIACVARTEGWLGAGVQGCSGASHDLLRALPKRTRPEGCGRLDSAVHCLVQTACGRWQVFVSCVCPPPSHART
jgi:hypothetical protein